MAYTDVPKFLARLRERESIGRLAPEAGIFTAARSAEIRFARWSEVDSAAARWALRAERMKMSRPHVVPLSPEVIDVFRRAAKIRAPGIDYQASNFLLGSDGHGRGVAVERLRLRRLLGKVAGAR